MKYFFFGGAPYVGKTESISRAVNNLKQKGFICSIEWLSDDDFFCTLDGKDKNNHPVKIIVASASDTVKIIDKFSTYAKQNSPYDFILSPIRDGVDSMRSYFFRKMNITDNDYLFEIPLAKITRITDREIAYEWYKEKIDHIVNMILGSMPFNI